MASAQATSEPAPEPRPGPTGMPLRLRPLDEVGDDEEVAGEAHLQMTPSSNSRRSRYSGPMPSRQLGRRVRRQPRLEPCARLAAQLLLGAAARGVEARQDRLALLRPEGAAPGDLDRVGDGLRKVGEQRAHLGRALEEVLRRQPAAVWCRRRCRPGDAEQRVVGLVHIGGSGSSTSLVATSGRRACLAIANRAGSVAASLSSPCRNSSTYRRSRNASCNCATSSIAASRRPSSSIGQPALPGPGEDNQSFGVRA